MSAGVRPIVRVGQGWDLHRLDPGGPLRLGGVDVPHDRGSRGHSDGDVVLHAMTDAVLGAVGAGDIGEHFSDQDPRWRNADSALFLREALRLAQAEGCEVGSVDVTVLLEVPKLAPHRQRMRERVADILGISVTSVSIKAKTNEGTGAIGCGDAVAALAIVCLVHARDSAAR